MSPRVVPAGTAGGPPALCAGTPMAAFTDSGASLRRQHVVRSEERASRPRAQPALLVASEQSLLVRFARSPADDAFEPLGDRAFGAVAGGVVIAPTLQLVRPMGMP